MSNKLAIYACSGLHSIAGALLDWKTNDTLTKYLYKGSEYFLYTYIPDSEVSYYSRRIRRKREEQIRTLRYVKDIFIPNYGTEAELDALIRNGIVDTFNGRKIGNITVEVSSPEEILYILRTTENGLNGVGSISAAVASIICAIIAAVVSIVTGLLTYYLEKSKAEMRVKYIVPDENVIADSVAEAEDWENISTDTVKTTKASTWMTILLIPTALWWILTKRPQK